MNSTLLQMSVLMACGIGWKILKPANLGAEQTRLILTSVVYYLFLPAMVLDLAMTVTVTTALSLLSLPFWHQLLANEFMK